MDMWLALEADPRNFVFERDNTGWRKLRERPQGSWHKNVEESYWNVLGIGRGLECRLTREWQSRVGKATRPPTLAPNDWLIPSPHLSPCNLLLSLFFLFNNFSLLHSFCRFPELPPCFLFFLYPLSESPFPIRFISFIFLFFTSHLSTPYKCYFLLTAVSSPLTSFSLLVIPFFQVIFFPPSFPSSHTSSVSFASVCIHSSHHTSLAFSSIIQFIVSIFFLTPSLICPYILFLNLLYSFVFFIPYIPSTISSLFCFPAIYYCSRVSLASLTFAHSLSLHLFFPSSFSSPFSFLKSYFPSIFLYSFCSLSLLINLYFLCSVSFSSRVDWNLLTPNLQTIPKWKVRPSLQPIARSLKKRLIK